MENKERVLGYNTSKVFTNEELKNVTGGSVKWTCHNTQQATGIFPGRTDGTADQEWD